MPNTIRSLSQRIVQNLSEGVSTQLVDDEFLLSPREYARINDFEVSNRITLNTDKILHQSYRQYECGVCQKPFEQLYFIPLLGMKHSKQVCPKCVELVDKCTACGYRSEKKKMTACKDGGIVCEQCVKYAEVFTCKECKEIFCKSTTTYYGSKNPYLVCQGCFNEKYFECSACGGNFAIEKAKVCPGGCERRFCTLSDLRTHRIDEGHWGCYSNGPEKFSFFEGKNLGEIVKINRFVGVEIECEQGDKDDISDLPDGVNVGSDGSLDDTGVEVRTSPASLDALETIVTKTTKSLQKAGFKGTRAAGLHAHVDVRDFAKDPEKVAQVVQTFYAIEDMLLSMLPPSRWNNRYCQRLCKGYTFASFAKNMEADVTWYKQKDKMRLARIKKDHGGDGTRYYGLNLHSLWYRGTIEFRYHSGTVSADKILNWVQILLSIVDWAVNNYDEKIVSAFFDMETSYDKIQRFWDVFNLQNPVRSYMLERCERFNKKFSVKFNKGYTARNLEITYKQDIEEMAKKNVDKFTDKALKEIQQMMKGDGIDISSIKKEDLDHAVKERALKMSLNYISRNYSTTALQPGFLTTEEAENIVNLILSGQHIANRNGTRGAIDLEY